MVRRGRKLGSYESLVHVASSLSDYHRIYTYSELFSCMTMAVFIQGLISLMFISHVNEFV
jgi:hypothetical protein